MPRYNHAVSIAFVVLSDCNDGSDFTPAMLKEALQKRIADLDSTPDQAEWLEAVGAPEDTYELSPEERFPLSDWQYEVANGDTTRSYQEWLESQVEMAADEEDDANDNPFHPESPEGRAWEEGRANG